MTERIADTKRKQCSTCKKECPALLTVGTSHGTICDMIHLSGKCPDKEFHEGD